MTPKAISHTQFDVKIEQYPHTKEMSIGELMVQHMNEEREMTKMSSKGQQRNLSTSLEVSPEEEIEYYEDITLKSSGNLEKLQRIEDDAHELKDLVVKEKEPTSPKPHEIIRHEIVKTILEMTLWGEKHEELKKKMIK